MPAHPVLNTPKLNTAPSGPCPASAPMLIAAGSLLSGGICAEGDILVHGHVQGDITAHNGHVFVMAGGQVDGSIEARGVLIDGILQGSCTTESLLVRSSGMIDGLVSSVLLELEPGGILRGRSEQRPQSNRSAVALVDFIQESDAGWLADACAPQTQSPAPIPAALAAQWKPALPWGIAGIALLLGSVILWSVTRQQPSVILPATGQRPSIASAPLPGTSVPQSPAEQDIMVQPLPKPSRPAASPTSTPVPKPGPKQASAGPRAEKPAPPAIPLSQVKSSPAAVMPPVAARPEPAPALTAPAPTNKLAAEGVWLQQLSDLQSRQLNLLIKASTRNSNSNQRSPLGPLISKTAQQLMLTRRLQRKYTAQHTVAPYIPSQDSSHFAAGISDAEIKQQYQAKLRALLAQADHSGFHPDSQQLITSLQQLASR